MRTLSLANVKNRHLTAVFFIVALGLVIFLAPTRALAHKVNVFAYVEGDNIIAESYFSDGRKCHACAVEVYDDKGKKLLEGQTNDEGRFSFRIPERTTLLIRLNAPMGHMAEYTIPPTDLPSYLPQAVRSVTSAPPPSTVGKAAQQPIPREEGPKDIAAKMAPQMAELEQIVDRSVARQLAPILRAMEEDRDKQRFSDIVGGIGYIIGLMGLAAYFHSRQRQKQG